MSWRTIGQNVTEKLIYNTLYLWSHSTLNHWTENVVILTKFSSLAAPEVVITENVVILTKFSSLAAPEVVILTTSGAASDEN